MIKKLILIFSLITFISCEIAPVDLSDENYKFDGNGGIKCRVNGKLIKPKAALNGTGLAASLVYGFSDNQPYISLSFLNDGESPNFISRSIKIVIVDINLESNQVGNIYILGNEFDSNYGKYKINSPDYNFTTNIDFTGQLEIVFHDIENRILGGSFSYDAVNSDGEVVRIKGGEFDMTYY
ncbi:hypothetical protein [Psychroserpens ponticola]|uniref:Lipoprotein n=1 Tax=Psychroserpens ponticola TaxID=2932268 RepID=A0ABY7S2B8_9FLAO|nr:hypothetical protein [Psychroserpens ponticola]WCO03533.1 hypothetical protein MUN68_008495 [Psychroserpens ponticola]